MTEEGKWMLVIVTVVAMMACSVLSHEATNPLHQQQQHQEPHVHNMHQKQQEQQQHQPPSDEASQEHRSAGRHQPPPRSMDRHSVHDEEHLKEHLDGQIKEEEKLSDEEMQFRYFKVHDYDGNNKLDGIELIKALTHHHKSDGEEKRIPDDELSTMINEILNDNDRNRDGYIDYAEFIMSQRSEGGEQ